VVSNRAHDAAIDYRPTDLIIVHLVKFIIPLIIEFTGQFAPRKPESKEDA
jgi:hypothetical protein